MERNDYRDEFENFLQEKADEYNLYPSDRVWSAIQQELHTPKRWPYLLVTLVFLGLGIFTSIIEPTNNQLAVRSPQAIKTLSGTVYVKRNAEIIHATNLLVKAPNQYSKKPPAFVLNNQPSIKSISNKSTIVNNKISTNPSTSESVNQSNAENVALSMIEPSTLPTARKMETIDAKVSDIVEKEVNVSKDIASNSFDSADNTVENNVDIIIPAQLSSVLLKPYQSKKNKISWQVYVSPTVSYRNLSGSGSNSSNFIAQSLTLGSTNLNNVNNVVNHKPALGMELGAALVFNVTNKIKLKTGLQFNYNQYDIQAYNSMPEIAPLSAGGFGQTEIKAISVHRSNNGFSQTWLQNLHAMLAIPIGIEYTILGNQLFSLNIASSIQPTYIVKHEAYMLSTNLNNYAKENSLNRNFNVNASSEIFVSMQKAGLKWTFGPQFRYQMLSSYKKEYPIVEHLKDFGFKIGMSKTIQ